MSKKELNRTKIQIFWVLHAKLHLGYKVHRSVGLSIGTSWESLMCAEIVTHGYFCFFPLGKTAAKTGIEPTSLEPAARLRH